MKHRTKPKLSPSVIYSHIHNTYKEPKGEGTFFGCILIALIGFLLMWRYQQKQAELKLIKDNPESAKNIDIWNTQNKMLEMQRREEKAQKQMEDYYMNNLHPQQKVQYILKQNNPHDIESYINEGIAQRAAKARYM